MGGAIRKQPASEVLDAADDVNIPSKRWIAEDDPDAENSLIYVNSPLYSELRRTLSEPLGQHYLANFAKSESSQENFFAWIDMEEYKRIPTKDYRRFVAKSIFQKYIKEGAVMRLGILTPERVAVYQKAIYNLEDKAQNSNLDKGSENSRTASQRLTTMPGRLDLKADLFVGLQHSIFREMADNTFKRFTETPLYDEYQEKKKKTYNRVDVDDFEYLDYIGQGAFGIVARVRKKSTGKEYAVKVMGKAKLIQSMGRRGGFTARKARVCMERNVYVHSNFPFIVDMHYAFQTSADALIVMEFVRGGTVQDLRTQYPDKIMPEDHVKFIIAELMLALRHLHCINYVHRDLKPINVLLDNEGHVKLTDMGLVGHIDDEKGVLQRPSRHMLLEDASEDTKDEVDVKGGDGISDHSDEEQSSGVDMRDTESTVDEKLKTHESSPKEARPAVGRRFTRVGTMGYKAPELLQAERPSRKSRASRQTAHKPTRKSEYPPNVMDETMHAGDDEDEPEGYGASVDWWSLGVMTLELLCGKNHYVPKGLAIMIAHETDKVELGVIDNLQTPSTKLPKGVSQECRDFVDGLLSKDPHQRLGTNEQGFRGLCNHAWFKDIDISKLLAKEIKPPYSMDHARTKAIPKPKWPGYAAMKAEVDMEGLGTLIAGAKEAPEISSRHQRYFEGWDYVAPLTFKLELGVQEKRLGEAMGNTGLPTEDS